VGRNRFARGLGLAAAATVAVMAGASEAVTYAEASIAGDFSERFEDRSVLPLDADVVTGVSNGYCGGPFHCFTDGDFFEFTGLAPGTSFSITLEMLATGYGLLELVADYTNFRVYDDAESLLFNDTHSPPAAPFVLHGVVPVSGNLVVYARGDGPESQSWPLTARYRVALDAQVIPEPATALLVAGGVVALGAGRRMQRKP
jgi:hypothetical protein